MLANEIVNHNGHGHAHLLECPSDYAAVDIVPMPAPKPGWRDQFPQFTHNLSWIDNDNNSHSMTLRSDNLQSLMADLKLLKGMIKASKERARKTHPEQPETQPESVVCKIHGVKMERRISKRNGGHYHAHKTFDGLCFGREKKHDTVQ